MRAQRRIEEPRETQRVINALPVCRDGRTCGKGRDGIDFRVRIRQCKDDLAGSDALRRNQSLRAGRADDRVRPCENALEALAVTAQLSQTTHRVRAQIRPQKSLDTMGAQQARDAKTCRTEPDYSDGERIERRAGLQGRVQQRGEHDDRRDMLVTVQNRDRQAGAQLLLDLKAARRADTLEQNCPEGGSDGAHDIDEVIHGAAFDDESGCR